MEQGCRIHEEENGWVNKIKDGRVGNRNDEKYAELLCKLVL